MAATAPTFGFATSTPAAGTAPTGTGFNFGFGATAATPASTSAPAVAPLFSGISGINTSASAPTAAVVTTAATTTPFNFGFGNTTGTGTPAATTTTTLTQQAAATPFSLNTGATTIATAVTTTTAATSTAAATATPFSFGFGTPATTTTTTTTQAAAPFTLNTTGVPATSVAVTTAAQTPANFGGLGGVHSHSTGVPGLLGSNSLTAKIEGRAVLELPLPPEIVQIVEDIKLHMKNQKVKMTELCRASDKGIERVSEEIEETRLSISNLTNLVHRQIISCNAILKDTQQEMKSVDMAMMTRDTPLVLQNEITAPTNYFFNLVTNYQERMLNYKREIERAEIALSSLSETQGFSSKDLIDALKSTKETVMVLAAKVQDLHEHVTSEMTVNRNLKRFAIGDDGGVRRHLSSTTRSPESIIPSQYNNAYDKLNNVLLTPNRSGDLSGYNRPGYAISTPLFSPRFGDSVDLFQTASGTILTSPGGALKRSKR